MVRTRWEQTVAAVAETMNHDLWQQVEAIPNDGIRHRLEEALVEAADGRKARSMGRHWHAGAARNVVNRAVLQVIREGIEPVYLSLLRSILQEVDR